jgi:predicted TIM-barrel fold metal-dependent hydrolase
MFESNFPVDKAVCSYASVWNTFKRLSATWSAGERADVFSGTACRIYRLSLD